MLVMLTSLNEVRASLPTCCHHSFARRSVRLDGPLRYFSRLAMFLCCVGDNQESGQVVETKIIPVLEEKGTQSAKEDASGSFTVLVPAKRHATLGLAPCLRGRLLWGTHREALRVRIRAPQEIWNWFQGPIMHEGCPAHLRSLGCSNTFHV